MMYGGVTSIIGTHFFIGVTIGVLILVFARWRGIERPFQFGGAVTSLGLPSRWLFWAFACGAFEVLSSCKSPEMYQEIALSLIEAPSMVLGLFVVDRLCRWEELEHHINERVPPSFQRAPKSAPAEPKPNGPDYNGAARRFDDLTKDK